MEARIVTPLPELRLSNSTETTNPEASVSIAGVTPDVTVCVVFVVAIGASLLLYVTLAAVPIGVDPSSI